MALSSPQVETRAKVSALNSSTTVPTTTSPFIGQSEDITSFPEITLTLATAQSGTHTGHLYFEFSSDNTHWDISVSIPYTSTLGFVPFPLRTIMQWFRVRYIPDDNNLTEFRLITMLHHGSAKYLTRLLSQTISDNEPVQVVRSALMGKAPTGTWENLKVDNSANLLITGSVAINNLPVTQSIKLDQWTNTVTGAFSLVGALSPGGNVVQVSSGSILVGAHDQFGIIRPLSMASGTQVLKVSDVGTRQITGSYFCASSFISGSAAQQTLFTITNPVGSGRTIFIKKALVQGVLNNPASTPFLYRLGRTLNTPSGGTLLVPQTHDSSDATTIAIIRQAPSASLANGSIWVGSPGLLLSILGGNASFPVSSDDFVNATTESDDIVLAPSESLAFSADANTVDWKHYAKMHWHEV